MEMEKKTAEALKALAAAMNRNQCYACAHEFVEIVNDFGSNILLEAADLLEKQDAIAMMKEQETELCDRCGRVRLKSKREGR